MIITPNDFWHKRKIDHFDLYNVLLAITTNISVLLMTAFVVQGHICLYICMNVCEQHPVSKNIEVKTRISTDSPEECLPVWFISRCDLHLYIPVPNSLRNQTSYLQHIVQKRIMNIKLQEKENTPLHVLNKKICRELTWRSWTSKCVFTLLKIFTVQWAFFKNQSWWDCAKMWVELCWGNKVNKVWHLKETQT